MPAYSFKNTNATITGPGGVVNIGAGAAVAEEGIEVNPVEDKNKMDIGADGSGQHSLIASDAAEVVVRLLKTSPTNKALMIMYNLQSSSAALWGQNVITVANSGLGDATVVQSAAFRKKPVIKYVKTAEFMEWTFDGISASSILGA